MTNPRNPHADGPAEQINRREFLTSLGLVALAGCKGSLDVIVDAPSTTKIVYCPDIHFSDFMEANIKQLADFISENKVDAMALEGLSGIITDEYLERIKKSILHSKHTDDFSKSISDEINKIETNEKYQQALKRLLVLQITPPLDCCKVSLCEKYAPGNTYAAAFYGKIPLFGIEDHTLYEKCVRIIHLYWQKQLWDISKDPKNDPRIIKLLAKHYPLEEYAKNKDTLKTQLGYNDDNIPETYEKFRKEILKDQRRNCSPRYGI
ncbi:MAG: hypothetical protein QXT19_03820 [Candidatus Woesearchaeota archaeon]